MTKEREYRVTIRISKEELNQLEEAAKQDDRTVSSFVRAHILTVAREQFGWAHKLAERERLINKELELDNKEREIEGRRSNPAHI